MADSGILELNIPPIVIPKKATILAITMHEQAWTRCCRFKLLSLQKYFPNIILLIIIKTKPITKKMVTKFEILDMRLVSLTKFKKSKTPIIPSIIIPHFKGKKKQHFGEFGSLSLNRFCSFSIYYDILFL